MRQLMGPRPASSAPRARPGGRRRTQVRADDAGERPVGGDEIRRAPRLFIELFSVPSWEEHLRQHRERQTGTDLQYHDDAAALSDPPPQTGHYLAADLHE